MAKKNGTSWLKAVKKILWSPSKDSDKQSHQKEADYNKKKEKKGWIFRKTKVENTDSITDTIPKAETEEKDKPAAAEVVKLTATPGFIRRRWATIIIQTAFRGYLAKRAFGALKGIVKLQALVRGHNVRNQAKRTLRCIKALVRVQDQVLNHHHQQQQRSRVLSSPSSNCYDIEARRNSMFAESNGFWDTKTYLQDIRSRRSLSRDMSRCTNEFVVNQEETQSILQKKLEIAIEREKAHALVLSHQIRSRSYRNQSAGDDTELLERTKWLDRWMATKQWDNTITRDPVKTLEMDTNIATTTHQRSYPATPPSCRATRTSGVRSASPRIPCSSPSSMVQPNYMSATESAKAKARTQSTPRRRPVITAKKRLCYAEEGSLRSPSLKSAYNGCLWGERESDYSCCCGDGLAGKVSPCSTSDLRWLK
ncbi:IQ-domain 16 [Raphanus sativus]|uniref:Protein IQ-DOMAIN 16 n=1 Tax=Raphanus sativus TaxID=3726 RepID=A0A6J0MSL2_RAPSA|nr:protein IQ-DOMAIN 16 [Raphanus sativus]KAJ4905864.1 IQ-domain 16 [Raphanus sativus]